MAEEREGRSRARDMACRDPILLLSCVCTLPSVRGRSWPFDTGTVVDEGAESEAPFCTCDGGEVGMGGSG